MFIISLFTKSFWSHHNSLISLPALTDKEKVTYLVKVPHLLGFDVLGVNVLCVFVVVDSVAALLDRDRERDVFFVAAHCLLFEAANDAADETHQE